MKKNVIYIFISGFISIIIPTPARFAYGIIILFFMNFMILFNVLLKHAAKYLNLDSLKHSVTLTLLVSVTILSKQLLIFFSPVMALTLSFSLYLVSFSSFVMGFLINDEVMNLKSEILHTMKYSGVFTLFALFIYFLRDIFGYGTITLPSRLGLFQILLPEWLRFEPSVFFASIPGAFVILAVLLGIASWINRKFIMIKGIKNDSI